VKCTHCGAEMMLKQEYCPRCGKKAVFDFDVLAASVHDDAAFRRGEKLEAGLKWVILLLLVVAAVLYGINDLFDQSLSFDGAALPSLQIKENVQLASTGGGDEYVDPRPSIPVPPSTVRVFGYRMDPVRSKLREINGGNKRDVDSRSVGTAVTEGLKFLAREQRAEGCWPVNISPHTWNQWNTKEFQWGQVGVTSLCLLAFLGEGESWIPTDAQKNQYSGNVVRAVRWLLSQQDKQTGSFGPVQGDANHFMYNHGMATLAMAEAAGMSGDPALQESAQKAVDFIVSGQAKDGGWNYFNRKEGDSDSSVSAWQVQALHAAREAGLKVPEQTLKNALEMYRKATVLERGEPRVIYSLKNDDRVNRVSLWGLALMIRQLLGEDTRANDLKTIANKLQYLVPQVKKSWGAAWKPDSDRIDDDARAKFDPYAIYFATYGMFFAGAKDWDVWGDGIRKAVPEMQDSDGCWRLNDTFTKQAGFCYSTALSILTLQVYYRIQ
jgi:hypothetical protein